MTLFIRHSVPGEKEIEVETSGGKIINNILGMVVAP